MCLGMFVSSLLNAQVVPDRVENIIDEQIGSWLDLYRDLHTQPELSFYEYKTAATMAAKLKALGFEVKEGVGGTGVVGVLRNGPGPAIMVRTDIDALPIVEETGLAYASQITTKDEQGNEVGVMHACGHDIHMTVWTASAQIMAQTKDQWQGTLIFIAQPAEERSGGAKNMLADGLFERFPRPDYVLALHANANMAHGKVGYTPGYAMANVDFLDITIYGEGGHGAYPHTTIDPVVLAARTILDLQTIVSREISPLEPAVLTVGSIHGGTKGNIIPNEVKLQLTLRSYSDQVKSDLIEKIKRICLGNAISAGLPPAKYPEIVVRPEDTPALYNDPQLSVELDQAMKNTLGADNVIRTKAVMGGEDFSRFGRVEPRIPIFLFWLGTVAPEKVSAAASGELELPSLHSSKFAPVAEPAIITGTKAMSASILYLLNKK